MPHTAPLRLKPLAEQVIVITGASSGIGRATALMAAARGAAVVLAARGQAGLQMLAAEIERSGGRALVVPCDVTDPGAMTALAERAAAWGGRIDSWVNNAGVAIATRLAELPEADARRLFDVNFWGKIAGCQAALPFLRRQGGALINIGSFVSDVASPYMGIYSASQHALRGYTDALRIELMIERAPVSVTLVKPAPIATPVLQHQRNRLEREASMPPPFHPPEDVAATILYAAEHRVRDLYVGGIARFGSVAGQFVPPLTDLLLARFAPRLLMTSRPKADRPDNLFAASSPAATTGDTRGHIVRRSLYTALRLRPGLAAALTLGAATALAGAAWARRDKTRPDG